MLISRTPYRISFFGGGTDYPAWYREHGGAVLATSIDKYCYLTCRYLPPFFEHRYRIVYSYIETAGSIDEIKHPSAREVLRRVALSYGVEVHHDGDLPARSGIGSSSAFTVGLLHALRALKGEMASKHQLAMESIDLEQNVLNETVGSQDQVTAAYGGLNHVLFQPNDEISVRPVTLPRDRLEALNDHFMLFYTGVRRTASDIAKSYVSDIGSKKSQLCAMQELLNEALALLYSKDEVTGFGRLMHEAWKLKRSLSSSVANAEVDAIYETARSAGAIGGKLTGAGGGGFMLLFAPPERQKAIRERLKNLLLVPFRFEFNGSQIIYYAPDEDYAAAHADRAELTLDSFRDLENVTSS